MVLQSGTLDRRAYKGKVPLRKSAPGGSCDAGSDVCMCMASCSHTEAAGEAVRRFSEERSSQEIKTVSCEVLYNCLSLSLVITFVTTLY